MKVKQRIYRFRILNASISRSYRPKLGGRRPDDGGGHRRRPDAGGEDGDQLPARQRRAVRDPHRLLPLPGGQACRADRTCRTRTTSTTTTPTRSWPSTSWTVRSTPTNNTIPTTLASSPSDGADRGPGADAPARCAVERDAAGEWTINGKTWHDVIDCGFNLTIANPDLDDVEIWEIENRVGGWFHPVHIHLVDFQILNRKLGSNNPIAPYDYEKGPKDVVYVGENETVRCSCASSTSAGST